LFTAGQINTLTLSNRIVRSATAERLTDAAGRPTPPLLDLYRELSAGGVGLIITGHLYIHCSGKCHPEMTAIDDDALIPALAELVEAAHAGESKIAAQINHGGMQCSRETVAQTIAPSAIDADFLQRPARAMTEDEIAQMIQAYAQAARRAQAAGFDAVQLHGAHGYLISQFLSPFVNRRTDAWGGSFEKRLRFLREVVQAVRAEVGAEYPLFIKLGMKDADAVEGSLTPEDGARIVGELAEMGLDAVEISGGIGGGASLNSPPGIRTPEDEAYFRPLAQRAREQTDLPIVLVGGMRSRAVMEEVLAAGDADFVSMSRPLICEPDLPRRLRAGQERAACISGNQCWPKDMDEGIACKCPGVERP
ncbi:MAG: NADH:flavin oxidoreductase, partial [Chloroflexi bacterium]|nr:NADH:flavin oxidoreductase [Chloroflexota bacterium]